MGRQLIDIREMSEIQQSHYYIEALPLDAAESLLKEQGFAVESHKDGFIINAEKEQIPAIINLFSAKEQQLFAIQPYRKTLEDEFLEMTGGGQIAEAHTK